ncbi:MAG: hypothetical protein IAE87_07780, partial [Rhodobacteraceae bacterium]|nr:hypothetical protein [Paracoccaceae bacterium]
SPRSRLRGLLWSDSTDADAQNSLRNALSLLRNQLLNLGYDGLQASRHEVWLEPDSFVTDLQILRQKLAEGRIDTALFADQGFPASILARIEGTDLFDAELAAFRQSVVRHLAATASAALPGASDKDQTGLLSLLVDLEPGNEAYHRALIARLAGSGRKAEALAVYQRLWSHLDTEYGEEPAAETQALIVALKQAGTGPVPEDRPLLLVRLEAGGMGPDTPPNRGGRLQDVLHLTLSALARFREWRVIDDRHVPDRETLQRQTKGLLCALTLVATPSGDGVERITAILTDLHSGQIIWSDHLGRDRDIAPETLDAVIRRFATAINLLLTGPGRPLQPVRGQGFANHYDLWLEAQQKLREFTVAGWRDAELALDRILIENPLHVRALSARASIETMRQIAFPGVIPTPQLHRRALDWASTAALTDPMDSRAQLALAWACAMSRQFDRATIAYELAFQHNENDPWTIASALVGFAFCEDIARARALADYLGGLGLALEPFHWSYLAAASFLLGDDAACIAQSQRAREISCDVPAWHAAALAQSGRIDEARRVAGRFIEMARGEWIHPRRPGDSEIAAWLLACFPIRSRARWNRLREGLALAGVPVPGQ